jgi:hypothetical protein
MPVAKPVGLMVRGPAALTVATVVALGKYPPTGAKEVDVEVSDEPQAPPAVKPT